MPSSVAPFGAQVAGAEPQAVETLQAQTGAVSGKVTDERGVPVEQVSILFKGTTLGALTNSVGAYTMVKVPTGRYVAATRRAGYASAERTVIVEAGDTTIVDFRIKAKPVRLAPGLVDIWRHPPVRVARPCAGTLDRRVGVAARFGKLLYFAIADSSLAGGTRVTVIDAERPERTWPTEVVGRTAGGDWPRTPRMGPPEARLTYYLLQPPGKDSPPRPLGFGVLNLARPPRKEDRTWVVGVGRHKERRWVMDVGWYVVLDYCTRGETLNLYLRSAVTGEECWHGEYYLGEEVEPACP